jgi:hypothetical protein
MKAFLYLIILCPLNYLVFFKNKYFPYVSHAKEYNLAQISSKPIVMIAIGDENIKSKIKTVR